MRIVALLMLAGGLLVACGEDDGDEAAPAPEPAKVQSFGIYDWEANVIPNPDAPPERATETPFARRAWAEDIAQGSPRCAGGCLVVSEGGGEGAALGWFVLRDRPALVAEDLVDPAVTPDPVRGEPLVAFSFTPDGRREFQRMTRRVAARGSAAAPDGAGAANAAQFSHHFAVVVNDEVVSRPIVDYAANPDGISGSSGASIGGGFTQEEAEALAAALGGNEDN